MESSGRPSAQEGTVIPCLMGDFCSLGYPKNICILWLLHIHVRHQPNTNSDSPSCRPEICSSLSYTK